jgi:hypothetical protein
MDDRLHPVVIWTMIATGIFIGLVEITLFIQTGDSGHLSVLRNAVIGFGLFAWVTLGPGLSWPEDD